LALANGLKAYNYPIRGFSPKIVLCNLFVFDEIRIFKENKFIMSYTTHWLHCVWRTKDNSVILSHDHRPEILAHFRDYAYKKDIEVTI
jgi:hypothetical protein